MSETPYIPAGCDPESILLTFPVPREFAGLRLDRFIQNRIPRLSRTRANEIVKACAYRQDGTRRRASERVRAGEVVLLVRPPMNEPETPQSFGVLYEDEHVLVVDKPAGLPMHPTATYHKHTLTWLLKERYPDDPPQFAHRLDRETSGVVVCGKSRDMERALKNSFQYRHTQKTYLAVVHGCPPETGTMDQDLAPVADGLHVMMEVRPPGEGLSAVTTFRTLRAGPRYALVELWPETGRQHQLRVHLAHLGFPIVGDKLYGAEGPAPFLEYIEGGMTSDLTRRLVLPRHALHAHALTIEHPVSGEPLHVSSPLPDELAALVVDAS
ncbi:MAG: RluA family pseudouridine synthase [Sandaracinaceae bacterium]|nr:RluA family pseudouridine synthase [Myxococcales bacterium]MCB9661429.1 RluA family pseudouridine synthase [Sandaracinaceae bacterium]